jgi:hypothetical protein
LVGLVIWPLPEITQVAYRFFVNFLASELLHAKIGAHRFGGLFGSDFVLITAMVKAPRQGIEALSEIMAASTYPWPYEVAFYEPERGSWVTTFPTSAAPFERFLTKENFEAAQKAIQDDLVKYRAKIHISKPGQG